MSKATTSNTAEKPIELKVAVCGSGGVGKSCITVQYITHKFEEGEYDPTIEDAYRKHCVVDNAIYFLEITDTAGQDEYVALRDQYMRGNEGFLIVYDVTSRKSLENLQEFVVRIQQVKEADTFPVVVVGNKCDMEEHRKVTLQEAKTFLAKECNMNWDFPLMETSAKKRINCDEAFNELIRQVRNFREAAQKKMKPGKTTKPKKGLFGSSNASADAQEDMKHL